MKKPVIFGILIIMLCGNVSFVNGLETIVYQWGIWSAYGKALDNYASFEQIADGHNDSSIGVFYKGGPVFSGIIPWGIIPRLDFSTGVHIMSLNLNIELFFPSFLEDQSIGLEFGGGYGIEMIHYLKPLRLSDDDYVYNYDGFGVFSPYLHIGTILYFGPEFGSFSISLFGDYYLDKGGFLTESGKEFDGLGSGFRIGLSIGTKYGGGSGMTVIDHGNGIFSRRHSY
ncbi:MAG: hypothetical protein LBC27_10035 [Spirochaetaceae bacterium]|jgi:hypothetical protein|nr:hypothetical protein [Spirochaetaceae bacterium]